MRGKDHISISMGSAVLLFIPWIMVEPVMVTVILIGVLIGSLLPDVDAKDSKINYMDIPWLFATVMDHMVIPVIRWFHSRKNIPYDARHRGSLHTVFSVFIYSLVFLLFGLILVTLINGFLLHDWLNFSLYMYAALLVGGLIFGSVLHLLEDGCTRSGVYPLQPFDQRHIRGGISTSDRQDNRPETFSYSLYSLTVIVAVAQIIYTIPPYMMTILTALLLIGTWSIFHRLSRKKRAGAPTGGNTKRNRQSKKQRNHKRRR